MFSLSLSLAQQQAHFYSSIRSCPVSPFTLFLLFLTLPIQHGTPRPALFFFFFGTTSLRLEYECTQLGLNQYGTNGSKFIFHPRAKHTHRFGVKLWRVVVDVSDGDESRGRVGEAEVQAALHVCGLHDQRVLRHFLQMKFEQIFLQRSTDVSGICDCT